MLPAPQGVEVVAETARPEAAPYRTTCIFELKVGEPVDAAFSQIREKGYADPYRASGKPIWLIGLSFDRETRKLVDCAARPLEA
ncbi:MAG: PD-(D/E)XK nuclease domain-containing protein [Kiritimatiellae bacterium]|nr:PD-(D/E)XK nuclease domain-containing protein [Kiritimatiellia bacterium]